VYQTSLSRPESRRVGIPVGTTRLYGQPSIENAKQEKKKMMKKGKDDDENDDVEFIEDAVSD
jgi:hypothetical protein